jgi:hypothetical protein
VFSIASSMRLRWIAVGLFMDDGGARYNYANMITI